MVSYDDLIWLLQQMSKYRLCVIDGEIAPVDSLRLVKSIDKRFKKYLL
ncbi:hypothetical protein [Microvirus mar57]|uniref:Uncharacterized protein n=1 Tax=Microvirus mar57 TaxID=2851193 RepID=A0A8F5XPL5_9VIRU|nr:hypothetical protein [Microvirus mar57]